MTTKPLWQPTAQQVAQARITAFIGEVRDRWNAPVDDYASLHRWSLADKETFWRALADFAGVVVETWGEAVLEQADQMPGARWFPGARLNFAENLLRRRDDSDAIVYWGEDGTRRRLSCSALHEEVARFAAVLKRQGVARGDRVAGYLPNLPETVIAALAAASIGAAWTSTSPDFGAQGVLDRFGQTEPKVLVAAEAHFYRGKRHDLRSRIGQIAAGLPTLERVVLVADTGSAEPVDAADGIDRRAVSWGAFVEGCDATELSFERVPFDHPLYIMYSSGTTGAPKCIVHGVGGTLLTHVKEQLLHCDVRAADRVFYFTTCGWMMWNWLVSALACDATLLLFDGSPFHPTATVLFDLAEAEEATLFGTSAKYIDALSKAGLAPARTHRLDSLRLITSTGSPLSPEGFDYVYRHVKPTVQLASISGGTDIIGCFVLGNPVAPVWRGEIQTRALGMQVEVFDEQGRAVRGRPGELVCTAPFPSMPVRFWNDPEDRKLRAAYFERYPGAWHHGDWAELTEHDGVIIHGRSDAVLNPKGVRIGTADIYRQVEQLDEISESVAVGQSWEGDVRVVLFVVLREGLVLDEELTESIKTRLREHCSPNHVPAKVVQVQDIPRTKNGKISEIAVRDAIHGRAVQNREALANPEALEQYAQLPELAD